MGIPEPHSECGVRRDERTYTTVRRHGNLAGPRLIVSHGNGLAVDLYYPFWSLLADEFDRLVCDLRNHGWNSAALRRDHNVPRLIRDHLVILGSIDHSFGEKARVGVSRSVTALTGLLAFSVAIPGLPAVPGGGFNGLILFDPPIVRPGVTREEFDRATQSAATATRARDYRFPSRKEYAGVLAYLPWFLHVVPGVRDLVARTTRGERGTAGSSSFVARGRMKRRSRITFGACRGNSTFGISPAR